MSNINNNPTLQTIVLSPGQTFYIPTGAVIIAKNATGDVDITSDCIDTTGEDLSCYGFIAASTYDNYSETTPWEGSNFRFIGVGYEGNEYDFSSIINFDDIEDQLIPAIQSVPNIGNLMFDIQIGKTTNDDAGVYGITAYIIFKTTPSIAKTLYLRATAHLFPNGDGYAFSNLPTLPYSAFDGFESHVPECTGSSSGGGQA